VAYEYGAHKDDLKEISETHQERIARWAKVLRDELISGKNSSPSPRKRTKSAREKQKKSQVQRKTRATETRRQSDQSVAAPASISTRNSEEDVASFRGAGTFGETISLNDITVPTSIRNDTDTSMVCIMCQEQRAEVVFEPCHHCVLCSRCSERTCKTFCPSCRTTITGRLRPSSIRVVRPRIYSSYSFM